MTLKKNKILIIAEAGVNHNGDEDLAIQLIDAAYDAGADIVKFQTFNAKKLATSNAKKANYQTKSTDAKISQQEMLSQLELSHEAHYRLIDHCSKLGIQFLSTAFDAESLSFLVNDLKINKLKIASGELTNAPLILEHAKTNKDIILSTGMSSLFEIEAALGVLAYGYTSSSKALPTSDLFIDAYTSESGQNALQEKVTLLHCTTEYPAPFSEVNLQAINTLKKTYNLPVGYSDHTSGINISIAAAACGAVVIEKHFTLDRNLKGPDHKASLEPCDLKEMIKGVRQVEKSMGDGIKKPSKSELSNISAARKSIVASGDISKGDLFTEENLEVMRPGEGLSPYMFWDMIGKISNKNYQDGDLIID